MSSDHPPWHGWRTRLFHLTRDRRWLLRTAAGTIASGLIISCLIVLFWTDGRSHLPAASVPPAMKRLQEGVSSLATAAEAQPRDFSAWLRRLLEHVSGRNVFANLDAVENADADEITLRTEYEKWSREGKILSFDVAGLQQKHGAEMPSPEFITAALLRSGPEAEKALKTLQTAALSSPPKPYANELLGSLMLQRGESALAADFFIAEGAAFADADPARLRAIQTAIHIKSPDHMRLIAAQSGDWLAKATPLEQYYAASLTGEVLRQWAALAKDHFTDIPWALLFFTLLAGAIWIFILVQHDVKTPWRWVWPLLPLLAGVASVWPVLSIASWQHHTLGMERESTELIDQMRYYFLGVSLREELGKLLLFALFLPWLLRARQPARALLCGAYVGLGFALEENVHYYREFGIEAAFTRLLTANFLHLALTGIAGHALYSLIRSGFRQVEHFLGVLAFVVLAHGAYDLFGATDFLEMGAVPGLVIFLTCAIRFLDELAAESVRQRSTLSLRAAFTLGCAVLVAAVFIMAALRERSMAGLSAAGISCLSIYPLVFLYWRRFEHD